MSNTVSEDRHHTTAYPPHHTTTHSSLTALTTLTFPPTLPTPPTHSLTHSLTYLSTHSFTVHSPTHCPLTGRVESTRLSRRRCVGCCGVSSYPFSFSSFRAFFGAFIWSARAPKQCSRKHFFSVRPAPHTEGSHTPPRCVVVCCVRCRPATQLASQ